jgi:hypothetical protein
VLLVGDSKMSDLPTRGHIVVGGSRYLGAYRPIHATAEIASWVDAALADAATWLRIETVDRRTGEVQEDAVIHPFERPQTWVDPLTQQAHTWTERVLVVRASAYQAGMRRLREQALERLTTDLLKLAQPPAGAANAISGGRLAQWSRPGLRRPTAENGADGVSAIATHWHDSLGRRRSGLT